MFTPGCDRPRLQLANPLLCSVIWGTSLGAVGMETSFAGSVEVLVLRNGQEVARVVRPLRRTPHGSVVRYKRKLWRLDGNRINISGSPLAETNDTDEMPDAVAPPAPALSVGLEVPDDSQTAVIAAAPEARLLVDAGPGTGKTHTACLRVAALIRDHDIPASRVWIISFTRTAVHEIRNRLVSLLDDESDAAAVRIATLDSLAWTVHSGFSKNAALTGSYDDNIAQTLAKIRKQSRCTGGVPQAATISLSTKPRTSSAFVPSWFWP